MAHGDYTDLWTYTLVTCRPDGPIQAGEPVVASGKYAVRTAKSGEHPIGMSLDSCPHGQYQNAVRVRIQLPAEDALKLLGGSL